jgi:hypothetical protein
MNLADRLPVAVFCTLCGLRLPSNKSTRHRCDVNRKRCAKCGRPIESVHPYKHCRSCRRRMPGVSRTVARVSTVREPVYGLLIPRSDYDRIEL